MNVITKLAVLTLALVSIFWASVNGQVTKQSTTQTREKGLRCTYPRVEVVSRQLFIVNGKNVESPVSLTEYTICDEQRRIVESGELLNGDPDTKRISRYDEDGNEIEHEYWIQDSLNHKSVSRYDRDGRMISQDYDDGTKARCQRMKKQSLCKLFDENGHLKKRWRITFDSHRREIQRLEFEAPRPDNRYVYAYDPWGNRSVEAHYYHDDGKERSSREFFTFDEKGKLLQKLWYDDTGLRTREVYEYNNRHDLTRRTEYNADKIVVEQVTLEYQSYDSKGNWTKAVETRIRSDKGKTTLDIRRVLYRTITYPSSTLATS